MTTIAWKDGELACDGRMTRGDTITTEQFPKTRRLKDGSLVAMAGNAAMGVKYMEWLGGDLDERPSLEEDDVWANVLQIRKDGTPVLHTSLGMVPYPCDTCIAIGSGSDFALAAMDFGRTAKEAVEYAMTRDPSSGGLVAVLQLEQPARKPKRGRRGR